ncbi:hypothetical protein KQ306_09090 [Synechococcus sp. CS-1324]|uniref:hypothetical protein n=1 Tax=Synechococcus sp. CS-1324 TaxID=2847980 RepID=UPI000DB82CCA|nr:hypothetical protein [Synechococcus sp. CS-1324]MCT0231002.1 hypothetical protein [Synechococcus sp. CS-1324]PZV00898.1 MAG: hypothetical protein DCF23_13870 [Cyanobium sp.]
MRFTALTNGLLDVQRADLLSELQDHGTTALVKQLQAVELQGAMVAMFDAALQDALDAVNGFQEAKRIIEQTGDFELRDRFEILQRAANVLKHGRGRSHDELMAQRGQLPFRVGAEDEFFNEGNVSDLATLVKVDSKFLRHCVETIDLVAALIRRTRPTAWV